MAVTIFNVRVTTNLPVFQRSEQSLGPLPTRTLHWVEGWFPIGFDPTYVQRRKENVLAAKMAEIIAVKAVAGSF